MVSISSFVRSFSSVAFSGSRRSGSVAASSCEAFLPALASYSGSVGVGCASGVDALIRSAFPSASVFRVQRPLSRAAFAARSARMVHWVASGSGLLIAFPLGGCPSAVRPSASFHGYGSGTWGSVALALGLRQAQPGSLGCSVLVVLSASVCPPVSGAALPAPAAVATRFTCLGAAPCGGSLWLSLP